MSLGTVADAAAWLIVLAATIASAVFATIAALRPSRSPLAVIAAVALLGLAVLVAALPAAAAPAGVTVLVTLAALVAAVPGGSAVTRAVLDRVTFDEPEGAHGGVIVPDGREVLRGGQVIGLLERLAVAGAIIAGFPEALAVIIAIKGVGRFAELETGAVRERFIVGTLTSWIWAAGCAAVVLLVR